MKYAGRWKLFGIVSFSAANSCGKEHHIAYTDVTKYLDWIYQYLSRNQGSGRTLTSSVKKIPGKDTFQTSEVYKNLNLQLQLLQ